MSITYAQYKATRPHTSVKLNKIQLVTVAGRLFSRWISAPFAGATPTTAAALSATTVGAQNRDLLAGTAAWIKTARLSHSTGPILIVDRLSHQGGLSGTVTGTVTTNLPTAALTRYTSGVGVMAFIEQYTQLGATATTWSCSYTNSAGVSGRTSPLVTLGGAADRAAQMAIPIPLQVGDVGIRSIESVALTATTGTAGNYGVTLVKPLAIVHSWDQCQAWIYDNVRDMGAWFEGLTADLCLSCFAMGQGSVGTYPVSGSLDLIRQ